MSFTDKTLTCKDCGQEFIWTSGEQEFYQARGLVNEPGRCTSCRAARRAGGSTVSQQSRSRIWQQVAASPDFRLRTSVFGPAGVETAATITQFVSRVRL